MSNEVRQIRLLVFGPIWEMGSFPKMSGFRFRVSGLGVLRQGQASTLSLIEGTNGGELISLMFSVHAEVLEAFRTFFSNLLEKRFH